MEEERHGGDQQVHGLVLACEPQPRQHSQSADDDGYAHDQPCQEVALHVPTVDRQRLALSGNESGWLRGIGAKFSEKSFGRVARKPDRRGARR